MKYGLKSVFRTPVKSILFLMMLTVITVFLSLGIGMWSVAEGMLKDADRVFLTAGEFTYTGKYDPNAYGNNEKIVAAYESLLDSGIAQEDEILYWEEQLHQKAVVENFTPNKWSMIHLNTMFLTLKIQYYMTDYQGYVALITKVHYSEDLREGTLVFIPSDNLNRELKKGEKLLVLAKTGTVGGMAFEGIELLSLEEDGTEPLLVCITEEYSEEDYFETKDGQIYLQRLNKMRAENYSQDLIATGKIEAVTTFHTGEYTLMQGEYFSEEDYVEGNACLIPKLIASQLEKNVGDTIHIFVYKSVKGKGLNHCYESDADIVYEGDFEIRGIYQAQERGTPIYIADSGQTWLGHSDNDNVLARVVLNNRVATKYCEELEARLPENVSLTINNEGYDASVQSIQGLLRTARILTITTVCITILIAGFFRYFFVYTNKENVKILLQLGTNERKTLRFFLTGSGFICLLSTLCGCTIGYMVAKSLIYKVFAEITQNSVYDFRYSVNGYGIKSDSFVATPNLQGKVFVWVTLILFLLLLSWCAAGIWREIISHRPGTYVREKKELAKDTARENGCNVNKHIHKEQNSVVDRLWEKIPTLSLRYAVRNIYRQGIKSVIIPVLITVLLTFLCVFTYVQNHFKYELEHVYEEIPVTVQLTDISGRKIDDLIIYQKTIDELESTGYIEESWKSTTYYAKFLGKTFYAEEQEEISGLAKENPYVYDRISILGGYSWETMKAQWKSLSEPLQIAVFLKEAPIFKYDGVPQIEWISGMDEERFLNNETIGSYEEYGCIVPDYFLELHDVEAGDLITLAVPYSYDYDISYNVVRIVGVYPSKSDKDALFMTPSAYENSIVDAFYSGWPKNESYIGEKWSSAGALLQNTEALSAFKDWLETCYDPIGKGGRYRQWLLIDDTALYDTIDNLTRYIEYMKLLYPVLIVLIIAVAFLISNMLLKSRLQEMAMLRSMGCGKWKVFCSVFLEYLLLSIVGVIVGLLLAWWLTDGRDGGIISNTIALLVCYYLGAVAAIVNSFRKALILSLKQKDE